MLEKILLLLFLYLPFQVAINPAPGVDLASVRLIIPILFLVWLWQGLTKRRITISSPFLTTLILSFLFLNGFSLLFAKKISWGFRKLAFFLSIFPLYFILNDLLQSSKSLFRKLPDFLLIGGGLSALIGIFQFLSQFFLGINTVYNFWAKIIAIFLGNSFSEAVLKNPSWLVNVGGHTFLRATAFFPDPHMFSFYLGMLAPIALAMFLQQKKNKCLDRFPAVVYLLIFSVLVFADLLTFSRGGYLGLLFGGILFFMATVKMKKEWLITISAMILSLIFVGSIIFPNNIITQRLFSSFNLSEGSNVGRLQTWQQSLEVIREKPIFGTGLGNYSLAIKPSAGYREPIYSHNAFLDIAVETGLLNALIWLLILLLSIKISLKNFARQKNFIYLGLASGLSVFLVHSLFETAIFSVHILTLVILLISLANHSLPAKQ